MVSLGSSRSLPETLFLDEVFGSLAPAVQERVFLLLKHLRSYFGRILVITHNPELRNRFSATLRVEKNNGISRVSILNQ
jgi:DNA repair exonuclease SbcCD ATPase subunit